MLAACDRGPQRKARALEFYRIWTTLPDGTSPARENLPAVLPAGSSLSISIRRRDRRFRRPIRVTVHIDVAATDGGDRPPRPKSRSELWRKQEVAGAATSGVVVATDGSELWLRKQRAATDG